jgi:hypothetical protein
MAASDRSTAAGGGDNRTVSECRLVKLSHMPSSAAHTAAGKNSRDGMEIRFIIPPGMGDRFVEYRWIIAYYSKDIRKSKLPVGRKLQKLENISIQFNRRG